MKNNTPTPLPVTPEIFEKMHALLQQLYQDKTLDNDTYYRLSDEAKALYEKYDFRDVCFEENGKTGLKDIAGTILVPAVYTAINVQTCYDPFAHPAVPAADASGKYALVAADGTGTPLTPFLYDSIHINPHFFFNVATQGAKCAILDANGKTVVPCIVDDIPPYQSRNVSFRSDGKWGLFNREGLYIPPTFDSVSLDDEDDDAVMVMKEGNWGYLDPQGNFIDMEDYDVNDLNVEILYWN